MDIAIWLNQLDKKSDDENKDYLLELGFNLPDNLPISCLPIEKMLKNYLNGHITEDMLTSEGYQKYQLRQSNISVDIFDFKTYFDDFTLFTRYFFGLELYLRSAIWINYKYEYLNTIEERNKLEQELKQNKDKKLYLCMITDSFEVETLVEKWYHHFNPNKLTSRENFIEYILNKTQYIAHPDHLFNQLYRKYVVCDHDLLSVLWFTQRKKRTVIQQEKKEERREIPLTLHYTKEQLIKLTCPQLKEILKSKNCYKGCSKLTKSKLIEKIITLH